MTDVDGTIDHDGVAVEDAGIFHGMAFDLEEEGGSRVADQQLVEIQPVFNVIIGRRRKSGGNAVREQGNGQLDRVDCRKPGFCRQGCCGLGLLPVQEGKDVLFLADGYPDRDGFFSPWSEAGFAACAFSTAAPGGGFGSGFVHVNSVTLFTVINARNLHGFWKLFGRAND